MASLNDFTIAKGLPFCKIFDTEDGQLLLTIEPNEDGNASYVFRTYGDSSFEEYRVGVVGGRVQMADTILYENFKSITAEQATAAFKLAKEDDGYN